MRICASINFLKKTPAKTELKAHTTKPVYVHTRGIRAPRNTGRTHASPKPPEFPVAVYTTSRSQHDRVSAAGGQICSNGQGHLFHWGNISIAGLTSPLSAAWVSKSDQSKLRRIPKKAAQLFQLPTPICPYLISSMWVRERRAISPYSCGKSLLLRLFVSAGENKLELTDLPWQG